MKKLIILGSVCSLMNSDVLAMESFEHNNSKPFSERSVDYRKAWTRSHTILLNHIENAEKTESDYEKALNIVKKAHLNVDACVFGNTLLHAAAELFDPRILSALLDKNPKNINAINKSGYSAFSLYMNNFVNPYNNTAKELYKISLGISEHDKSKDTQLILKSGIDNDVSENFAKYDREKEIDTRRDRVLKKFVKEISSQTLEVNRSAASIIEKFIECGADINIKNPTTKETAFHLTVHWGDIEGLRTLLNYDSSSINDLTDLNLSALDYAVQNKNIPIIELLIKKGAKVSFENLKRALEEPELLKILLPNKDSLSKIENGEAILSHCSVFDLNEEVVDFLIDRGASVDTPSFLSDFIYHYKGNNKKLIDKVIEASGNLDCVDYTGWRFKHINPLISEKLSQAKADNAS